MDKSLIIETVFNREYITVFVKPTILNRYLEYHLNIKQRIESEVASGFTPSSDNKCQTYIQ